MTESEAGATRCCFELDVDLGIGIGVGEFSGAPSLHDALARNELEILTGDIAVPRGEFATELFGNTRGRGGHRSVAL